MTFFKKSFLAIRSQTLAKVCLGLTISFLLVVVWLLAFSPRLGGASNISTSIQVISVSVCGNDIVETGEDCDGSSLNNQSCETLGYAGGVLSCHTNCTFNVSACRSGPPLPAGPGSEAPPPAAKETIVILKGMAYPEAVITVLRNGQAALVVSADKEGGFEAEILGLSAGLHHFGLWAKDSEGRRSISFSFSVTVLPQVITRVQNILVPPTIELNKDSLQKGDVLRVFGQATPNSQVFFYIEPSVLEGQVRADSAGQWAYSLDTAGLAEAPYQVKAKTVLENGLNSTFSSLALFSLEAVPEEEITEYCQRADLNGDGKVDLVDFSILLYWWGRDNACSDQNNDGKVDLLDLSIMMYWWTG